MHRFLTRTLLAVGAVIAAVVLTASAAFAATWSVTNGGSLTVAAGTTTIVVHDPDTGDVTVVCASSGGTATVNNGEGRSGTPIGLLNTLSLSNCVSGGIFPVDIVPDGLPWDIDVTSQAGTVVSGNFPIGVGATFTIFACTATVDGPVGPNDGSMPLTYDNNTNQLTLNGGGNLRIHNADPDFCGGFLADDDPVEIFATYTVAPGVQINQTS